MKKSNKILWTITGGIFGGILALSASFNAFSASERDNNAAQIISNGHIVKQAVAVPAFDSVNVDGKTDVTISHGQPGDIMVSADENILPYLRIAVSDKTLNIGIKSGIELSPSQTEKVFIPVTALHHVRVHGNTVLNAMNVNSDHLTLDMAGKSVGTLHGDVKKLQVNLRGNSDLHLNIANADAIDLKIAGKGEVYLTGNTNNLNITTGGKAIINAKNLVANQVTIISAGESQLTVHAVKTLAVTTAGKSNVQYYGNPAVTKTSFGAATVEKLGDNAN